MTPWVDICTLTQPKGVKGRLGVALAPGFFALEPGLTVSCVPPALETPREHVICASGQAADGSWWVELSDVTTRDEARALQGRHCLARRDAVEQLEPMEAPDAIDWAGWTIVDDRGTWSGVVESVQPRPLQPLLNVRDAEGREVMVPLAVELIIECDEDAHRLTVELPSGLIDL